MRSLGSAGYTYIDLAGLPGRYSELLNTDSSDVQLWVDDDAKEFAASYGELERIAQRSSAWKHFVFLRDGLLQITATSQSDQVEVLIERCPGLNKIYLSHHLMKISSMEYLATWRNAMRILCSASMEE